MVIPITARPMIDSLLVGPEEFASVVASSEGAFENSGVYIAFTDAADVFHRGYNRSGKDALKPASWFPVSRLLGQPGQPEAANSFAAGVKSLPSGHFALGRAALKAALRGSGANLQIDPSRTPRSLPKALVPSTDTWFSIQVRHSREMQGPVRPERFLQLSAPDVQGRLLKSLGLEPSRYEIELEKKLAEIFGDHKKSGSDRRLALKLWLEMITAEASRVEHYIGSLKDHGITLDKFLDVAFNLKFSGSSNEGYQILGHLLTLGPQFEKEVSEFLNILKARLKAERPTKWAEESEALLNLYGGILAYRGHPLIKKPEYAPSITYGALALLDFAKLPFLPSEVRAQALRFALYALPEFVPLGNQIAYDWLLWQIEVERDPHIAFLFATEYAGYFKFRSPGVRAQPTFPFQDEILHAALKRGELNVQDRDALWDRLVENRPIWSRWWRRAFRHIGPYADPRPPSPTRQPA